MTSSYRPERASEEVEILNQRESTAPVAGAGLRKSTGWFLTSTSGRIPTGSDVVRHANVAGGQGRPPHAGDIVGIGGAQTLTATSAGARLIQPSDKFLHPSSSLPASLAFIVPFCVLVSQFESKVVCGSSNQQKVETAQEAVTPLRL